MRRLSSIFRRKQRLNEPAAQSPASYGNASEYGATINGDGHWIVQRMIQGQNVVGMHLDYISDAYWNPAQFEFEREVAVEKELTQARAIVRGGRAPLNHSLLLKFA